MRRFLKFNHVTFAYPGMSEPLLANVDAYFPEGEWTGVVGANGCGKTTLLRLAAGGLEPTGGRIERFGKACYVVQRTDAPPDELEPFIYAGDPLACEWRRRLGIGHDWAERWDTLSHGERKRAQIAVALWQEPDILALDEPTNHLDAGAKALLLETLRDFGGAGFIVSHDRAFLDALCSQCLLVFPPSATLRPGGVTEGMEQDRREQAYIRERDETARSKSRNLREAAQERREKAEQLAARNKAKRNARIPANDHDGRAKRNLAKLTGKNAWAASQSSALARRAGKEEAARRATAPRKEYEMGFWVGVGEKSRRNFIVDLEQGEIPLGDGRVLSYPQLRIAPDDRIALTGANGLGKSTLLRLVASRANVPAERTLVVPQEITEVESRRIHAEVRALGREELGRVMTSVSRLGSRPGRLLASDCPSPGEIRKILLALGVNRGLHFLAMDEPTNHLDLPSIDCLGEALAECPCAMLLVSHDERFLAGLARTEWHLEPGGPRRVVCRVSPR